MLRTFLARSCMPQRIAQRPLAVASARFISTSTPAPAHPEGKECYLERLSGDDHGNLLYFPSRIYFSHGFNTSSGQPMSGKRKRKHIKI